MTDPASPDGGGTEAWESHLRAAQRAELTPRRAEMARLADAMRRVIGALVATQAPDDEVRRAADELTRLAARWDGFERGSIYEGFAESANSGGVHGFYDHSPLIGRANPIAPPISIEVVDGPDGEMVVGEAVFGAAYEGPPGCVHGGFIAASFDEVLGVAQSIGGAPGMTGTLTIRYRSPTPLHTPLRFEGRLDRTEGRKIFTTGTLHAGDRLCAEAEAIFVSIGVEGFTKFIQERRPG